MSYSPPCTSCGGQYTSHVFVPSASFLTPMRMRCSMVVLLLPEFPDAMYIRSYRRLAANM
eukprot:5772113-Prymnesium_polylepis.1